MNRSIVINREFGSGGREIGRLVAEQAGMALYDSRILTETAVAKGYPADLLEQFDERVNTGQFFDMSILGGDPETAALPYRLYTAIAEVIVDAAKTAPAVFIGRCADRILADARLPFRSVFVYSTDTEAKIARAMEVDGIERHHAERYIAKMDKSRSRYQQFFAGTTFGDPREYDLCLNSGRLGYPTCVELILGAGVR